MSDNATFPTSAADVASSPSKSWRVRLTYTAMSLLVVWHTLAMVIEASPENVITRAARTLFQPYLALFRLNNNWSFFAPNVAMGVQFRYVLEDAAGNHQTFVPAEALSRFDPASHWFKDRYKSVLDSPDIYAAAAAASLCREHAASRPVSITLLAVQQKVFSPDDRLNGKDPLDPEFVDVDIVKTVPCSDK